MRSGCPRSRFVVSRGAYCCRGDPLRIRPPFALFPFDLFELRAVDIAISNDMLCCLDALRWGRADLHTVIADGDARVRAVIERWGLRWPDVD